jgi:hypothetical protein
MPNGLPEVGPLVPISRSPGEVTATWYVNDIVRGDLVNGVVTSTGGMSATYIPPRCPPPRNPVVIRFVVANNLIPQVAARGLGRARVRVLPRKWKMKVDPVAFGGCNATWSVSDSVHWTDPYVEFTLDDNLRGFAEYAFAPGEHSRNACQTCPSGYTASVVDKGGGDLPLRVSLQAAWNTDLDELEVVLRTSYEGPQDLWFRCTRADGQFVDTRIAPDEVGFGFFDHLFAEPGETKAILEELFPGDPRTIFLNLSLRGVCP